MNRYIVVDLKENVLYSTGNLEYIIKNKYDRFGSTVKCTDKENLINEMQEWLNELEQETIINVLKENEGVFATHITKGHHLYIEGLNEFGETVNGNVSKIKNILVELFDNYYGYVTTLELDIELGETLKELKEKAIENIIDLYAKGKI